jgi:uncharacterized protein
MTSGEPHPVIDFHQHLGHYMSTVEDRLRHQELFGVSTSVLLPIDGTSTPLERWPAAEALAEARYRPDRFVPFFHVDPRRPRHLDLIRRAFDEGYRGFGEHKVRLPVDAPESMAIYRLCGELGWSVVLHLEYGAYNHNFTALERVLAEFPDTVFVGHGPAFWAHIEADPPTDPSSPGYTSYPRGPVEPGGLTDRWLAAHPNLYGDLSAGSGLNALTRDPAFTRRFLEQHWRKLLWATDCPCRDGAGDFGLDVRKECVAVRSLPLLRELAPSPDAHAAIVGGNAQRLLRLG